MGVSGALEIEIGDDLYQLEVDSYFGGKPSTFHHPPEDGEIELEDVVWNKTTGEKLTLDEFIKVYAEHHDIDDLDEATRKLTDWAFEEYTERLQEDFDDQ